MLKLSRPDLAAELHVTPNTIASWQKDGMPHHREGRCNYYILREVVDYLLAREGKGKLDPSQERAKLHKSQRQVKELELQVMQGKYLPAEDVERFLTTIIGNSRSHFLSLPHKLAPAVLACQTMPEVEDEARKLVYEALNELSEKSYDQMMAGPRE